MAPVVAMATEPAIAEPTVPSLVDRYFTRWYKAGKWGMMSASVRLPWPDPVGTVVTDHEPRSSSPCPKELDFSVPSRRREWQLHSRGGLQYSRAHSGAGVPVRVQGWVACGKVVEGEAPPPRKVDCYRPECLQGFDGLSPTAVAIFTVI